MLELKSARQPTLTTHPPTRAVGVTCPQKRYHLEC